MGYRAVRTDQKNTEQAYLANRISSSHNWPGYQAVKTDQWDTKQSELTDGKPNQAVITDQKDTEQSKLTNRIPSSQNWTIGSEQFKNLPKGYQAEHKTNQ